MPRNRKKTPPDFPASESVTQAEPLGRFLTERKIDLPPPEPQGFAAKVGPRRREVNEPGTTYDGPNLRVTMDADSFMIDVKRPLTTAQQDRIVAAGFDDVSECQDGTLWLAERWKVARTGTDMNVLAVTLDGKGERLAQGRGVRR